MPGRLSVACPAAAPSQEHPRRAAVHRRQLSVACPAVAPSQDPLHAVPAPHLLALRGLFRMRPIAGVPRCADRQIHPSYPRPTWPRPRRRGGTVTQPLVSAPLSAAHSAAARSQVNPVDLALKSLVFPWSVGPRLHGRYWRPEGVSVELPLSVARLATALSKELEGGPCVKAGEELPWLAQPRPHHRSLYSRFSGMTSTCPRPARLRPHHSQENLVLLLAEAYLSAACSVAAPSQVRGRVHPAVAVRIVRGLSGRGPIARSWTRPAMVPRSPLSTVCPAAAPSQVDRHRPHSFGPRPTRPRPHRRSSTSRRYAFPETCPRPTRPRPHRRGRRYSTSYPGPTPVRGLPGRGPIAGHEQAPERATRPAARGLSGHGPIAARFRPSPSPPPSSVRGLLGRGPIGVPELASSPAGPPGCPWPSRPQPHRRGPVRLAGNASPASVHGLPDRGPIAERPRRRRHYRCCTVRGPPGCGPIAARCSRPRRSACRGLSVAFPAVAPSQSVVDHAPLDGFCLSSVSLAAAPSQGVWLHRHDHRVPAVRSLLSRGPIAGLPAPICCPRTPPCPRSARPRPHRSAGMSIRRGRCRYCPRSAQPRPHRSPEAKAMWIPEEDLCPWPARPRPHRRTTSTSRVGQSTILSAACPGRGPIAGP